MCAPAPAALLLVAAQALAGPLLTLEEAVRMARKNHPTVEAQRAQVTIARGRTEEAAAGLLPFLTGSFAYQPQTPNYVVTPATARAVVGLAGSDTIVDAGGSPVSVSCRTPGVGNCTAVSLPPASWALRGFWSANAGVAWTLWDWGHSIYALQSSRAVGESARVGVTTAERNVALDVEVAYFTALASDEALAVADDAVANYALHYQQTQAFHEAGLRTGIDVATAESGLATVRFSRARALAAQAAARAQLAVALGADRWLGWQLVPDPRSDEPQREDELAAPAPASDSLATDDALTELALRRRTEMRQLDLLALGGERAIKSARGQYLPQISLLFGPTFAGMSLPSLTGNFELSLAIGYPASGMSPLLVHGQVKEAEGNLLATRAQRRALRDAIRQETVNARALLYAARDELRSAQALVAAATRQRDLAEGRYAAGVGNIIELSDALLTFVSARYQLVDARLDLGVARARLRHALGDDELPSSR